MVLSRLSLSRFSVGLSPALSFSCSQPRAALRLTYLVQPRHLLHPKQPNPPSPLTAHPGASAAPRLFARDRVTQGQAGVPRQKIRPRARNA